MKKMFKKSVGEKLRKIGLMSLKKIELESPLKTEKQRSHWSENRSIK